MVPQKKSNNNTVTVELGWTRARRTTNQPPSDVFHFSNSLDNDRLISTDVHKRHNSPLLRRLFVCLSPSVTHISILSGAAMRQTREFKRFALRKAALGSSRAQNCAHSVWKFDNVWNECDYDWYWRCAKNVSSPSCLALNMLMAGVTDRRLIARRTGGMAHLQSSTGEMAAVSVDGEAAECGQGSSGFVANLTYTFAHPCERTCRWLVVLGLVCGTCLCGHM